MSRTDAKLTDRTEAADQVAQIIGDFLEHLHDEMGIPLDIVLAGAHGEIVAAIIDFAGPDVAAASFRSAAAKAHDIAALRADPLASMPAEGRA
jgi:ABC-type phosphate/phosphonate transport system substrate-binding protein